MQKKAHSAMLAVFFLAIFIASSSLSIPGNAVSISEPAESSENPRVPWARSNFHRRLIMDIGANGTPRRNGQPVEMDVTSTIGPDIASLDVKSFRVEIDGEEIPSQYETGTNKLIFTIPDSFADSEEAIIYYDVYPLVKSDPGYLPDWVKEYEGYESMWDEAATEAEARENEARAWKDEKQIEEVNGTYYYNGSIVYYNETEHAWLYENNDSLVLNYVMLNDGASNSTFIQWDAFEWDNMTSSYDLIGSITFDNASLPYTWQIFNGTQLIYTYYENQDQDVYLGSTYFAPLVESFVAGDSRASEWSVGPARASGTAHGDYNNSMGNWVRQSVSSNIYRGSPRARFNFSTNSTDEETAFGTAVFDLNGTITFNDTIYGRNNLSALVENAGEEEVNYTLRFGPDAKRLIVTTECGDINVEDLNWSSAHPLGEHPYSSPRGLPYGGGDQLNVIPILVKTRWLVMHDSETRKGAGFGIPSGSPLMSYLLEFMQEIVGGIERYYVRVSANYNAIPWLPYEGDLHELLGGAFDLWLTLLDQYDLYEIEDVMQDLLNGIQDIELEISGVRQLPMPILIHLVSPPNRNFARGLMERLVVNIDVVIEGETLASFGWKLNGGSIGSNPFPYVGNLIVRENQPSMTHMAKEGIASVEIHDAGEMVLTVSATDTNGTIYTTAFAISVEISTTEVVIISGLVFAGIGALSFAAVYRARIKKGRGSGPGPGMKMTWFKV